MLFEAARRLVDITQRVGIPMIFKSSYEKDNRGSEKNWKGPMAAEGLKLLAAVRKEYGIPVLTDIHRVKRTLRWWPTTSTCCRSRPTCANRPRWSIACGETGKAINVKKGQFLAPETMDSAVSKIRSTGNQNVLLTERGACFGYNRLVADMRSVPMMQQLGRADVF